MLLAVDIGNSAIKFGVFDGEILHSKFSIPTETEDLKAAIRGRLAAILNRAIVSSVVPEVSKSIQNFLRSECNIEPIFVTSDFDLGLKVEYSDRSSLGTDRLINAFAAAKKYGAPCIVCSFGTATTIDAVSRQRDFLGAIIAPGLQMMADALHHFTSKLPAVDVRQEAWVFTPSTEDCIRAGAFHSQLGLVELAQREIKKDVGDDAKVIATGGFASMIAEKTDFIDVVDEDLLLHGLRSLAER